MTHWSKEVPLPAHSYLEKYFTLGAYTDCLTLKVSRAVSIAELIEAFYVSPVFRPERILLGLMGMPSDNLSAKQLAAGDTDRFAAWHVEARGGDQILLCDYQTRTRSWLMVVPATAGNGAVATELYFGSAITTIDEPPVVQALARFSFRALLWFHKAYARSLLWSAARQLRATAP